MVVRGIGEEAEQIKCDDVFSGYVTITLLFSVLNLEGSNGRIYCIFFKSQTLEVKLIQGCLCS